VAKTVNSGHIGRHYYVTCAKIDPNRIVPIGPELDLSPRCSVRTEKAFGETV
jgi:glutathionyl-hydroquinone reductase